MSDQVRLGGRVIHRDHVVKVGVLVHPLDRDEEAPLGLYTLQGGPRGPDGSRTPERIVSYKTVEDLLTRVGCQVSIADNVSQWVDNQLARLLQFRRMFVITSTGEVYT